MAIIRVEGVRDFFLYARRRHQCYLRRASGQPPPWTDDAVISSYRFTNIYRELDRTTIWCRENVRERYDGRPEVIPALVLFRWFNRIETGEAMFLGGTVTQSGARWSPFDEWVSGSAGVAHLRAAIVRHRGAGPYVNGAYIIKTPNGMSKLDGVLDVCEKFRGGDGRERWTEVAASMAHRQWSLQEFWEWLRSFECQGDFTAYEVTTDMRWTTYLQGAPDIMTWANPGPGANRGLNRVQGRPLSVKLRKEELCAEMQALLRLSRSPDFWPREWGHWEMRDVEHTLCEFDKWMRALTGDGTPKQRYDQYTASRSS